MGKKYQHYRTDPNGRFLVWGPQGKTNPSARYRDYATAEAVAMDMAERYNQGQVFYVMELVAGFQQQLSVVRVE